MTRYWQLRAGGAVYPERSMTPKDQEYATPVVVIDPDDTEQVERLRKAFVAHAVAPLSAQPTADVQHVLREFASPTPPKPDEPTGLGAVVEDIDGSTFVRVGEGRGSWLLVGDGHRMPRRYSDIAAVRVLSPGVAS